LPPLWLMSMAPLAKIPTTVDPFVQNSDIITARQFNKWQVIESFRV
jgi:hypothetical protein